MERVAMYSSLSRADNRPARPVPAGSRMCKNTRCSAFGRLIRPSNAEQGKDEAGMGANARPVMLSSSCSQLEQTRLTLGRNFQRLENQQHLVVATVIGFYVCLLGWGCGVFEKSSAFLSSTFLFLTVSYLLRNVKLLSTTLQTVNASIDWSINTTNSNKQFTQVTEPPSYPSVVQYPCGHRVRSNSIPSCFQNTGTCSSSIGESATSSIGLRKVVGAIPPRRCLHDVNRASNRARAHVRPSVNRAITAIRTSEMLSARKPLRQRVSQRVCGAIRSLAAQRRRLVAEIRPNADSSSSQRGLHNIQSQRQALRQVRNVTSIAHDARSFLKGDNKIEYFGQEQRKLKPLLNGRGTQLEYSESHDAWLMRKDCFTDLQKLHCFPNFQSYLEAVGCARFLLPLVQAPRLSSPVSQDKAETDALKQRILFCAGDDRSIALAALMLAFTMDRRLRGGNAISLIDVLSQDEVFEHEFVQRHKLKGIQFHKKTLKQYLKEKAEYVASANDGKNDEAKSHAAVCRGELSISGISDVENLFVVVNACSIEANWRSAQAVRRRFPFARIHLVAVSSLWAYSRSLVGRAVCAGFPESGFNVATLLDSAARLQFLYKGLSPYISTSVYKRQAQYELQRPRRAESQQSGSALDKLIEEARRRCGRGPPPTNNNNNNNNNNAKVDGVRTPVQNAAVNEYNRMMMSRRYPDVSNDSFGGSRLVRQLGGAARPPMCTGNGMISPRKARRGAMDATTATEVPAEIEMKSFAEVPRSQVRVSDSDSDSDSNSDCTDSDDQVENGMDQSSSLEPKHHRVKRMKCHTDGGDDTDARVDWISFAE
jgi:hypothetical protein